MSTSYYHHTIIDIIRPASIYLEIHSFNIEYFTNFTNTTNMNNMMINMLVDVIDSSLLSDGEERDDDVVDDDDDDDDGGGAIINSRLLSDDLPMSPRVSRRLQPHQ